jgi:diguanylate cyclase (GGDEF)-like protein
MKVTGTQSPARLVFIVLFSIFGIELGVMGLFFVLPADWHGWMEALFNSSLLSALLAPVLFFVVFRPMTRQIEKLEQTQQDLRAIHEQLELRVRERTIELEERNREISLLAEMSGFLQACNTADEAYGVIIRTGQSLFRDTAGALFIYSASRNDLEAAAAWGRLTSDPSDRVFAPDMCWALRRGRVHRVDNTDSNQFCRHVPASVVGGCLCIPMIAQGEVLGVLHLRHDHDAAGSASTAPLNERMAVTLGEHIALALINLKLQETLRNQSIRDPLTGLFNRRYMEETLEREVRRAQRARGRLGVVMLDLDHFKRFNDTSGHEAGDLLLREVGAVLNAHIRGGDLACRYGGEEFTLIFPEMPMDSICQRVETLRLAVKDLNVRHRGQSLESVTVSAGVAAFPEHGASGEALLRAADSALYRAKAEGRDRVVATEIPTGMP